MRPYTRASTSIQAALSRPIASIVKLPGLHNIDTLTSRHHILTTARNYSLTACIQPRQYTSRALHTTSPSKTGCGRYDCVCPKCLDANRKPTCEGCKTQPTTKVSTLYTPPRVHFTSFCDACYKTARDKLTEPYRLAALARQREQHAELRRKVDMMQRVRRIETESTVRIRYAVDRMEDQIKRGESRWCPARSRCRLDLIGMLAEDLEVVKVRNKYVCSKERVDAMDFSLWNMWKFVER